jgi:hypothetical protein
MRSLDIECVLCACGTRERVVQGLRLGLGSGFKILYRTCSLTIECVLCAYRMREVGLLMHSLTLECVLLL